MNPASTHRSDHAREIRYALADAAHVCERLGLLGGHGTFTRQAGGVIIRCPWHEDRTPSCSVRRGRDGTLAVRCHACGETGDVLSLVAVTHGLSTRRDFRQVLRTGAELAGLWAIVHELDTGEAQPERTPVPAPPPEPERTYPPSREVAGLWALGIGPEWDPDARAWLEGRGLDAELVGEIARVLPVDAKLPRWASYQRMPWTETGHRLIVPMHDAAGELVSVRAVRIVDGDTPKRLPPGGHRATALVMACEFALAMLRGTYQPARIVVAEGEPDWMTWSTRRLERITARLGIVTGSWTPEIAARIPDGAEVIVRSDHDQAGDAYAQQIWSTLRTRCFVRRGGQADG